MNTKLTARNRQILETLSEGKSLMETSALLGVSYPSVCTTRGILKFQGFDTSTSEGREKCRKWLSENPALKENFAHFTNNQMVVAKLYAHGKKAHEIAPILGVKTHTVEMYFSRMMRTFDLRVGNDRLTFLRKWLVDSGFYPAGYDFTAQTLATEEVK